MLQDLILESSVVKGNAFANVYMHVTSDVMALVSWTCLGHLVRQKATKCNESSQLDSALGCYVMYICLILPYKNI